MEEKKRKEKKRQDARVGKGERDVEDIPSKVIFAADFAAGGTSQPADDMPCWDVRDMPG